MRILSFLSLALLGLSSGLGAQTYTDYEWPEPMASRAEIPAEFADAKAVIQYSEVYNRSSFEGEFPYIEQFSINRNHKHIKILKEEALEDYKRIAVPRFRGRIGDFVQLKHLDIRIRRKGSDAVEDLNIRELEQMVLKEDDELYSQREDYYVLKLPELQVGDELEQITVIEAKFSDNGGSVTLYERYPVLESVYTLSVPRKVKLDGRMYNNMPDPETSTTVDQKVFRWRAKNLKSVPEANSQGTIYTSNLAYFVYELNFDNFRAMGSFQVKNWSDLILQHSEDFISSRVRSKKKLEAWYKEHIFKNKEPKEISALEKVFFLNEYLINNVRLVAENDLESNEKSSGIEYFLEKNKITPRYLSGVYRDFFERYGIKYFLGFGKSRFSGPLDFSFVSNSQLNNYLFFVQPEAEGAIFIINGLNAFNEIPSGLFGTTCYMRDLNDKEAKLLSIELGEEPLEDTKNLRSFKVQARIDLAKNSISCKSSFSSSGLYASERSGYLNASKNDTLTKAVEQSYSRIFKDVGKVAVQSASIEKVETITPFLFKLKYEVDLQDFLNEVEGGYELKLDGFFRHQVRPAANAENRVLDYHIPFLGTDVVDYYLVFEKDMSIKDMDKLAASVDTDAASYDFKLYQVKPNILRIESRLRYKKLFLKKEEVVQLKQVNDALYKATEAKILFEKK